MCFRKNSAGILLFRQGKKLRHQIRTGYTSGILFASHTLNNGEGLSIRNVHGGAVLHRSVRRIPISRHCGVYIGNADITSLQLFQVFFNVAHRFFHIYDIDICPQDAVIL